MIDRLFLLSGLLVVFGSAYAGEVMTDKNGETLSDGGKTGKHDSYAHLNLDPLLVIQPPTVRALGLKGPVATVECISPVFDGQYEAEEGEALRLTFDYEGRLLEYDFYDFGDAAGHSRYTFIYNNEGKVAGALSDCMNGTQDPCQEDQSVISTYTFTYQDDRLTGITEHTCSVWGETVYWPEYHFMVSYTSDGSMSEVKCVEQPNVNIRYRDGKECVSTYYNQGEYTDSGCLSVWKYFASPDFYDVPDEWLISPSGEELSKATFEYDSHGNWTKCRWPVSYPGYSGEDGQFRKFTYY